RQLRRRAEEPEDVDMALRGVGVRRLPAVGDQVVYVQLEPLAQRDAPGRLGDPHAGRHLAEALVQPVERRALCFAACRPGDVVAGTALELAVVIVRRRVPEDAASLAHHSTSWRSTLTATTPGSDSRLDWTSSASTWACVRPLTRATVSMSKVGLNATVIVNTS